MYCGSTYLVNSNASPVITDFNDDGIADLLLGSQAGKIYVYINTGTPESYSFDDSCFTLATEAGMIDLGYRASIQSVDLNGDDLDDILAGYVQDEKGHICWLRNLGPESEFRYAPPEDIYGSWGDSLIVHDHSIYPSVADLNGDGSPDMIVGDYWGEVFFYQGDPESGIASPPAPGELSIRENPVSGSSVRFQLSHCGAATLLITDLSGRILCRRESVFPGEETVELAEHPAGIYSAVLLTETGFTQKRFTLLRRF